MKYSITPKQLRNLVKESSKKKNKKKSVKIPAEIVDLSDLTNQEKQELKLKEKIVVDNSKSEYPIVMIQLRDGKYIIFDVNGEIVDKEQES